MEKRLFYLINLAQHRLYRSVDQASMARTGVPVAQAKALFAIGRDGCRLGQLGEQLNLKKPAVTGLLQRMAKNGLVTRHDDAEDARATIVRATEAGLATRAKLVQLLQELNSNINGDFSSEELEVVVRFLNHIATTFE